MKTLLFALLFLSSFASLVAASEPAWQELIGDAFNDLAGTDTQNASCPFLGDDPNCGKYVIGLIVVIMYIAFSVLNNVPSEVSLILTWLLIILLATWGFLPSMFVWVGSALAGVIIFLMIYRLIGG